MRGKFVVILILLCHRGVAQHCYEIRGVVKDSVGADLFGATVRLALVKDTFYTTTDKQGCFVFVLSMNGEGTVRITFKGYRPLQKNFRYTSAADPVQLGTLILRTDYQELDEVVVTHVRPVVMKGDTVTYHTTAFPVSDGSDVEDILKRLPGVEVDIDGDVIVQGKKISKILVDGKEFFGSDVLLAIQNLPANVVDKLQIIDDYGDKARLTGVRSGDAAKVLNIVLKPDKRNGEFGRAEAGSGTQDKYLGDAFAKAFNGERQMSAQGSISNNNPAGSDRTEKGDVNYANQWNPRWSGAINLCINTQSPHSSDRSYQEKFYPGETLQQTQDNYSIAYGTNTSLQTNLSYKPDQYSTLRFTASSTTQQTTNKVAGNFTTLQQDSGYTKSAIGQSVSNSHSTTQTFNSSFYYKKLSPFSRRRFSIEASLAYTGSNAINNSQSTATVVEGSISTPSILDYLTSNGTYSRNMHINSNLFLPVGRVAFLELDYRVQSTISTTNVVTQQPDSGSTALVTIDSLSQHMVLHDITQDFHTAYTAKLNRLDITAGFDAQPGMQKGTVDAKGDITSYSYFSLLPNIQAVWKFDKSRRLNLNYTSQPNLPSVQQLVPLTNVSNPQCPVTGNPDLKPSYTNNLALHYEQSSLHPRQFFGFGMGLIYSATRNTIIQNLTTPKDSSQVIQATTYLNAGTTNNLTADYHLSLPAVFDKRVRINFSGSFGKTQTVTMTDSIQYLTQTWTWNQSAHLQLLIPDVIETDLSGHYNLIHTLYAAGGTLPNTFRSASLNFDGTNYPFRKWIVNYRLSQFYTTSGNRLLPTPASLTASLQRQFLRHNKATIILTAYNLLNQSAVAGQSISPTTITYNRPTLTGRYFLLTFQLKLQRFRK